MKGDNMYLYERLQKAIDKGYIPVHVKSERCYFFVENDKKYKIGEMVKDALGHEYEIAKVFNEGLEVE